MKGPVRFLVLSLLLLSACVEDSVVNAPPGEGSVDFTIEEARNFFESQTERNLQGTRADGSLQQSNPFNPGDFTPVWDKAKTSQSRERASVDIPILSSYRFRALQSSFNHGRSKVDAVNISQKLVVVKDLTTGRLGSYILTLIPDSSCGAKDVDWCSRFLNSGDKGKFSGLALYTESSFGLLIRVSQYREGRKINGVYIPGPKAELQEKMLRVKSMLHDIRIGRAASRATRGGEDDWWNSWIYDIYNSIPDGTSADIEFEYDKDDGGWWAHIYDGDGNHVNDAYLPDPDDPSFEDESEEGYEWETEPDPEEENGPGSGIEDDICPGCGTNPCICNESNGNEGTENSQLTQKIFNLANSNLTQVQIQKLNSIVNAIARNKVGKLLCVNLSRLNIRYEPNLSERVNGKYNPNNKTVYMKDLNGKGVDRTMVEELTHALQDQLYPGGIKNYGHITGVPNPPGFCNIEFEAHMIKGLYDLMNGDKISGYGFESTNTSIQNDLEMIMNIGIIDEFLSGQTLQEAFLNDFMDAQPHYRSDSSEDIDMSVFNYIVDMLTKN